MVEVVGKKRTQSGCQDKKRENQEEPALGEEEIQRKGPLIFREKVGL